MAEDNSLPNAQTGFWANKELQEHSANGKEIAERSQTVRPYFNPSPSLRDRVASAMMAFQQGMAASKGVMDPTAAVLSSFAGGFGAPSPEAIASQRAQQQAAAQMAAFEATPIEDVSPDIAEKFGLQGVPLGLVNKISPFLQRHDDLEKQSELIRLRGEEARKNIEAAAGFRNKTMFQAVGNRLIKMVVTPKGEVLSTVDMGLSGPAAGKVAQISGDYEGAKINMEELTALAREVIKTRKPEDLKDLSGLFGQLKQGVSLKLGEKFGTDENAVKLIRGLEAVIPRFARAVGHVGVLTQQDVDSIKKAMPTVWDNEVTFNQGLQLMQEQMDNIMSQKIAAYNAAQGQAAPGAPSPAPKPKKPLADLLKENGL